MCDHVGDHPGHHRVAIVLELTGQHQCLQLLHRLAEIEHGRAHLGHRHAVGDQVTRQLRRLEWIERDLEYVEGRAVGADVVFDLVVVGHLAAGDGKQTAPAPAVVLAVGAVLDRPLRQVVATEKRPLLSPSLRREQLHLGGDVDLAGQVEADVALHAAQVIDPQIWVRTSVPRTHVHPGRIRIDPDVEALGEKVSNRARHRRGLTTGHLHVVDQHRDAQVRIGLDPHRRIGPIVDIVEREDDREEGLVLHHAIEDLGRVRALLIADAGAVSTGGGDHPQQRLVACAGRRVDHVEHIARLVRVQLVDDAAVDVQAVQRAALGGQRQELAGLLLDEQLVLQHLDAKRLAHLRLAQRHAPRVIEHDARLVARGCRAVHLGPRLVVGAEQVQGDARRLRRLAVLARDLFVGAPVPAQACVAMQPAEHRGQDEHLPRLQLDAVFRSGPAPFGVRQQLDERADARRRRLVEAIREDEIVGRGALQVALLALARELDPLACDDHAGEHVRDVLVGDGDVAHFWNCPQPAGAAVGASMPGNCG
ncbi:hypothetical protein D3C72_658520 [compost metagenome]